MGDDSPASKPHALLHEHKRKHYMRREDRGLTPEQSAERRLEEAANFAYAQNPEIEEKVFVTLFNECKKNGYKLDGALRDRMAAIYPSATPNGVSVGAKAFDAVAAELRPKGGLESAIGYFWDSKKGGPQWGAILGLGGGLLLGWNLLGSVLGGDMLTMALGTLVTGLLFMVGGHRNFDPADPCPPNQIHFHEEAKANGHGKHKGAGTKTPAEVASAAGVSPEAKHPAEEADHSKEGGFKPAANLPSNSNGAPAPTLAPG